MKKRKSPDFESIFGFIVGAMAARGYSEADFDRMTSDALRIAGGDLTDEERRRFAAVMKRAARRAGL
ncbi:MAG TPA: hypothetical protein VF814_04720 [Casimicrobiaceae bacterium]